MIGRCVNDLQGLWGRGGERHLEAPAPQVVAELLAEQHLHVGLVVHDEDGDTHVDLSASTAARGKVTMNSANWPGSVATSIVPACCFATMSKERDSPRPVPSPAGLVVKNGSKIRTRAASGMPMPLSRTLIST